MNRFIIRLKFFKVFFVEALIVEVFIDLAWVNINLHTPLYYLPHLQLITFIGVLNVSIKLFYQYDYCIPGLLSKYSILLYAVNKFVDKFLILKQTWRQRASKVLSFDKPSLLVLAMHVMHFLNVLLQVEETVDQPEPSLLQL